MRQLLLIILTGILVASAATVFAARCFRPANVPACPTPAAVPACYMIGTQASASYISCVMCHNDVVRRIG